jgi:MSHA biogenesis protein MshG
MALFEYTGRTASGESVRGRLESGSAASAASDLNAQGILPVRIHAAAGEANDALESLQRWWHRRNISLTDIIMFCRQMKTLTRSGVPITRALRGLSETVRNPEFGRTLSEVADELEKGHDLAGVLGRQPKVFSKLFVAVIHIGETSGRLEDSFEQLHGYLELEDETRKRIKSALRYPTMVIASIVIAVGIINAFVIPPFIKLFAGFGEELPWSTQLLMTSSELTTRYWHFGVVLGGLVWWVFRKWLSTPEGLLAWHRWQLHLPGLGSILERALLARFCRTVAITLGAGLPVTQCLSIASRAVDNEYVAERILDMRKEIESGDSLTSAAHSARLFTPLVLQMIAVGEETGGVEQTLTDVASYYEREVDYDLKRVSEAIEPIMLIFVGALVLCLAMGVYLPMWEMASAARN